MIVNRVSEDAAATNQHTRSASQGIQWGGGSRGGASRGGAVPSRHHLSFNVMVVIVVAVAATPHVVTTLINSRQRCPIPTASR